MATTGTTHTYTHLRTFIPPEIFMNNMARDGVVVWGKTIKSCSAAGVTMYGIAWQGAKGVDKNAYEKLWEKCTEKCIDVFGQKRLDTSRENSISCAATSA